MSHIKSFSPGQLQEDKSTLGYTKEDIRLDQLIPSEILEDRAQLQKFLEKYYEFMNMDEFTFTETETFNDIILDGIGRFRIPDPENKNNRFFTDETGGASTLTLTAPNGTTTNIPLNNANVTISNGNELPGTLADSTSEIGKTFTVTGLSAHNGSSGVLSTTVRYWVGPGPSYVMNEIERHMDIDENDQNYLELMQKEIAPIVPRDILVNKRTLYKQFIDFYKRRGTSDSIETFFRILFNDNVEVEYPYDSTLIPSSGNWEVNAALPKGGQYLDKKGFLSDTIKVQDSLRYQKFSYVIKSGTNITDWNLAYNRLVHPAGFKYFAEILLLLLITNAGTVNNRKTLPQVGDQNRFLKSAIPFRVPGVIGAEDLPVLVEAFASSFTPGLIANRGRTATFSVSLNNSGGLASIQVIDPGFGYLSAPTLTINGQGSALTAPQINLGALTSDGSIDPDNITITSAGSGYTQMFIGASEPVDGSNVSRVGKIVSTSLYGLADKTFKSAPTVIFDQPLTTDVDGNFTGTRATATLPLDSEGEITGVTVTNIGSGYTVDPEAKFTTGAQNEIRAHAQSVKNILNLNHTDVNEIVTQVKVNPVQSSGSIMTSTGNADKFLPESKVKVINPQYRTIEDNGYQDRKGDGFFANQRLYNTNYPISFFSSQTIQNIESSVINNYNTNSFINIE